MPSFHVLEAHTGKTDKSFSMHGARRRGGGGTFGREEKHQYQRGSHAVEPCNQRYWPRLLLHLHRRSLRGWTVPEWLRGVVAWQLRCVSIGELQQCIRCALLDVQLLVQSLITAPQESASFIGSFDGIGSRCWECYLKSVACECCSTLIEDAWDPPDESYDR